MERVRIDIVMRNAAFDDEPMTELARVLREYAAHVEETGNPIKALYDVNGNCVGQASVFRKGFK